MNLEHEIHNILAQRGFSVTGNEYRYFCVRGHDRRTPSLHVNYQKGVFHCFGCGWSGTLRALAEELGIMEGEVSEQTSKYLMEIWLAARPISAGELLTLAYARSLSLEVLSDLDIRRPPSFAQEFADYLLFPIRNFGGKVVSFIGYLHTKGADSRKPKYKHPRGAPPLPFGLDSVRKYDTIELFVVEGIFDAISAWEWGYASVALLGTHNYNRSLHYLKSVQNKKIMLAPDFDKAGQQCAFKWAAHAVAIGLKNTFVLSPSVELSDKDFNDLQRNRSTIWDLITRHIVHVVPAPLYVIENATKNSENILCVLYFLAQSLGGALVEYIPFLRKEFADMLMRILESAGRRLPAAGESAADIYSQINNTDYLILTVAATSVAGRAIISSYFLPSEVERLFFFVPLLVPRSNYIPLFNERDIAQAARRFARYYRRMKGNALLDIATYARNMSFYTALGYNKEGGDD